MCTSVSNGTGQSAVIKLDASAMVGGGTSTRYAIGMGFKPLFDATTDVTAFDTGNTTSSGFLDFTTGYGAIGLALDQARPGSPTTRATRATDILLTTAGHSKHKTTRRLAILAEAFTKVRR
jgi:hypothetical protein